MSHPEVCDELRDKTSDQDEHDQFLLTEWVVRYNRTAEREPTD